METTMILCQGGIISLVLPGLKPAVARCENIDVFMQRYTMRCYDPF